MRNNDSRFWKALAIWFGVTVAICVAIIIDDHRVGPIFGINFCIGSAVSVLVAAIAFNLDTRFQERLGTSIIVSTFATVIVVESPQLAGGRIFLVLDDLSVNYLLPVALFIAVAVCVPVAMICSLVCRLPLQNRKNNTGGKIARGIEQDGDTNRLPDESRK